MLTRYKSFSLWTLMALMAIVIYQLAGVHPAMAAVPVHPVFPIFGFGGVVVIRNLFTREAIIRYLQILGPQFPTPCLDTVFTDRPQQPGPLVGSDIIKQSVKAMPLARRGGRSINISGSTGTTEFYEPLPIHPDIAITGAELNNLRLFMQGGPNSKELLNTWAQNKTEILRRTVRNTTEAMCASALTGTLAWPVKLEGGGFENYTINYGTNLTIPYAGNFVQWDNANVKISDVQNLLIQISVLFQENGTGQKNVYWAGKDAFIALYNIASKVLTSSRLSINISGTSIDINGTVIQLRSEQYWDPQNAVFKPIVPVDYLKVIDVEAGHRMPYAAIDDLDGNLEPMPFFIKPIRTENPSGYSLIAESKPLPVVNTLGICDIQVLST